MSEFTREILDVGDGAAILPYDAGRGTIILIRQFRGVAFLKQENEGLIEACAGKLEGADALTRIVKETEEETGIRLKGEPQRLFEAYSSPGSFAERLTYFVAPYSAEDRVSKGGGPCRGGRGYRGHRDHAGCRDRYDRERRNHRPEDDRAALFCAGNRLDDSALTSGLSQNGGRRPLTIRWRLFSSPRDRVPGCAEAPD